jgi:hypothetical protein
VRLVFSSNKNVKSESNSPHCSLLQRPWSVLHIRHSIPVFMTTRTAETEYNDTFSRIITQKKRTFNVPCSRTIGAFSTLGALCIPAFIATSAISTMVRFQMDQSHTTHTNPAFSAPLVCRCCQPCKKSNPYFPVAQKHCSAARVSDSHGWRVLRLVAGSEKCVPPPIGTRCENSQIGVESIYRCVRSCFVSPFAVLVVASWR